MNTDCALCGTSLTSMDTLLGENKLSDGGVLCNKCLNKITDVHKDLVYDLNKFSIQDIHGFIQKGKAEPVQEVLDIEQTLPVPADQEQQKISRDIYKRRKSKIQYELKQLNANLSVFTKGEIKELPYLIPEDEKIIAITDAQFINTLDAGILVVTPQRIISVSKSMLGTAKVNSYSNETIRAVSFVTDPRSPVIRLHLDERIVEFECYRDKEDAERFYDQIKLIYNSQKQIEAVKNVSSEDVFEQLEKLGKLRENGILTEAEFAEQKSKLLNRLS